MAQEGTTLIAARKALEMTQAELAELAGVNQGYLSLVEAGQRSPSPSWLQTVHQAIVAALVERGAA